MSGLPTQIPIQSLPIAEKGPDGSLYIQFDWYLFLYNLAQQIFGTQGDGSTPVSPFDALSMANLIAQGADLQHVERGLANLRAQVLGSLLPDPVPMAQSVQAVTVGASPFTYTALANGALSITGGAMSAVSIIRQGISVATGIASTTDEKGSGGTYGFAAGVDFTAGTSTMLTLSRDYGSAANLWVAFDGAEQGADSYSLSGMTLTFTAPIPVGTSKVYVKGAGVSAGLIPLRRLDQVKITYTSAPTLAFLPQ